MAQQTFSDQLGSLPATDFLSDPDSSSSFEPSEDSNRSISSEPSSLSFLISAFSSNTDSDASSSNSAVERNRINSFSSFLNQGLDTGFEGNLDVSPGIINRANRTRRSNRARSRASRPRNNQASNIDSVIQINDDTSFINDSSSDHSSPQVIMIQDNGNSIPINQNLIDLSESSSESETQGTGTNRGTNSSTLTERANTENSRSRSRATNLNIGRGRISNIRSTGTSPVRATRVESRPAPRASATTTFRPVNRRMSPFVHSSQRASPSSSLFPTGFRNSENFSDNTSIDTLSINNTLANFILFGSLPEHSENSPILQNSYGALTNSHPRVVARVNNRTVFGSTTRISNAYVINFSSPPLDLEEIPLSRTKTMTFIRVSDINSYLNSENHNARIVQQTNELILIVNGNDNLTFICSNVLAQPNYSILGSGTLSRFLEDLSENSLSLPNTNYSYEFLLMLDEMENNEVSNIRSKPIERRKPTTKEAMVADLGTHSRNVPIRNSDDYYNGPDLQESATNEDAEISDNQLVIVCNKCNKDFMSETAILASNCGHPMCQDCFDSFKPQYIPCPSCNSKVRKSQFVKVFHS